MYNWLNTRAYGFSTLLAEDAGAPELRNPRHSAMRSRGWLSRWFKRAR